MPNFRSLVILLILATPAVAQLISGKVVDANGAGVAGADVELVTGGAVVERTKTGVEGIFTLQSPVTRRVIRVSSKGFATQTVAVADGSPGSILVTLQPAAFSEEVKVSVAGLETTIAETPASIAIVSPSALELTAAQTVDDALRQVPGFSLFRRGSSRTANPTVQGANLRGVSGSGASRTTILFDGSSLNDAFGGWTYWSRVPLVAVEQIEVLRGGASAVYGTGGLSGAINIVPAKAGDDGGSLRMNASAGSAGTYDAGIAASAAKGKWALDVAGESFQTLGYIPVVESERGLADSRADSRHYNGIISVERRFSRGEERRPNSGRSEGSVFFRGNIFDEYRNNGTNLTYNKTYFRQASAGFEFSERRFGTLQIRTFFDAQVYDQTFSAVSAERDGETLTRLQRVPSQAAGATAVWSRSVSSHTLSATFQTREVRGSSDEVGFVLGRASTVAGSGGRERTNAISVLDHWAVSEKFGISLGLRVDTWNNFDAYSATRPLSGGTGTSTMYPDRNETAFSPRFAAIVQAMSNVSVYGSYSRSFRAPTLNELYRGFRVGNVVTQANSDLAAEYANTIEGGMAVSAFRSRFSVRGNLFAVFLSGPIVNVTLSSAPSLTIRQRQNAGASRSSGVEVDAEIRPRSDLKLSVGYLIADARVTAFPTDEQLVGKRLPQSPRQQFSLNVLYRFRERISFGIQGRASGPQWEDDLNTLRLGPYFVLDAMGSLRLHKLVEIFAAGENILNRRNEIGRTPNLTVAAPAYFRLGLRFDLRKR